MKVIKIMGTRKAVMTKFRVIRVIYYLQLDSGRLYEIQDGGRPKRKRLTRKIINYNKLRAEAHSSEFVIQYWGTYFSDMNVSEYIIK